MGNCCTNVDVSNEKEKSENAPDINFPLDISNLSSVEKGSYINEGSSSKPPFTLFCIEKTKDGKIETKEDLDY